MVEGVVLQHGKGGFGGALFDPVPVLGNALGQSGDGRDLEAATVLKGEMPPAAPDVFALGGDGGEGVDEGAESKLVGREGIGDDGAFHPGDGDPSRPGEIFLKEKVYAAIEGATAEKGVGPAEKTIGVDGDGEGELLSGELLPGEGVGEDGGDDVFRGTPGRILTESEVEVPP